MVETELIVSDRLAALLPPLTDEERTLLEQNLKRDGRVLNPILYWHDGKQNVVVDGMHRYTLATLHGIPYHTEPVVIGKTYDVVERWIWDHAAGQRNLSREAIGKWYNKAKGTRGGGKNVSGRKVSNDTLVNVADEIAKKTGVGTATVKRAGARAEALAKCTPEIRKGVGDKATDAQIKKLAKMPPEKQNIIAREVRHGKPIKESLAKVKPAAKPRQGEQDRDPRLWKEIEQHLGKALNRVDALHKAYPSKPLHTTLMAQIKQAMATLKGWKEESK